MNRIEELKAAIGRRLPGATLRLDTPRHPDGVWWLDVQLGERGVVVEWRPLRGFGLSALPDDGLGSGADEIYREPDEVVARVVDILEHGKSIMTPEALDLRHLRESQHVSQHELAELLGTKQAAISKIERRPDISVSTLKRFIEALGGDLEIYAQFGKRRVRIDPSGR